MISCWTNKYINQYRGFNQAIWLNISAVLINTLGFIPGTFFALYLVSEKSISIHTTAIFMSIGSLAAILGSMISGILGDRYSPIKLAASALFLQAIFLIMFPYFKTPLLILLGACLLYFTYSIFKPLNNIILMAHSTITDRPRVMGFYRMAFNLGLSFSMIFGGFLADHHFSWYFYFSGVMTLIATLLFVRFRKTMTLPPSWHAPQDSSKKLSKLHIFQNKPFMLLSAIYLGYCLIYYQVRMTFGLYMTQTYHLSFGTFGMLYVINMILVVVLEVPIMNRLKHQSQIKVCMAGIVFIALGLGMLPLYSGLAFAALSVILWSIGEILTSSPFYALVMDYANPRAKGAYIGFFQSLMSVGSILSQVVGGFIYTLAEGKVLWFGCFFGSFILIAAFMKLKRCPLQSAP